MIFFINLNILSFLSRDFVLSQRTALKVCDEFYYRTLLKMRKHNLTTKFPVKFMSRNCHVVKQQQNDNPCRKSRKTFSIGFYLHREFI